MTTIELGGVTFQDHPAIADASPTGWFFQDLIDWYGVPDSKAPAELVPQAHGSFDPGVDWREPATPSFVAIYVGSSEADALAAAEEFCELGTSEDQQVMRVTDALRTTSREVSVRRVKQRDHRGARYIMFDVDTLAPDPLRYGDEVVGSTGLPSLTGGLAFPIVFPIDFATTGDTGRIVTANTGKQDTFSRFVVTGGLAGGFSLIDVEDGREIRFEFPIDVGHAVTVDQRTGRAWLDSEENTLTGYLTKSEWWPVPAGGTRSVQFNSIGAVTGTPTLTAYTAPPYL